MLPQQHRISLQPSIDFQDSSLPLKPISSLLHICLFRSYPLMLHFFLMQLIHYCFSIWLLLVFFMTIIGIPNVLNSLCRSTLWWILQMDWTFPVYGLGITCPLLPGYHSNLILKRGTTSTFLQHSSFLQLLNAHFPLVVSICPALLQYNLQLQFWQRSMPKLFQTSTSLNFICPSKLIYNRPADVCSWHFPVLILFHIHWQGFSQN